MKLLMVGAALAVLAASPASAITAFATFTPVGSNSNVFASGSTISSVGEAVTFRFLDPNGSSAFTDVAALLNFTANIANGATFAGIGIIPVNSGTISFTTAAPVTFGGHTGSNLLTAIIGGGGAFTGPINGSVAAYGNSRPPNDVTFTSDFLDFSQSTARDVALAINAINPSLTAANIAAGTGFAGTLSGNFGSDSVNGFPFPVSEPASLALMALGLGFVVARARRASANS